MEDELVKQNTRVLPALIMTCLVVGGFQIVAAQEPARTIEIHAKRYNFTPSEITLKPGETVTLHLVSEDVAHSLLIPELKVNQEVSKGHPVDVKVTPNSTGDFRGKCGRFCGSGHGSMTFTVHVKG
jgi:cytochrome c oxidase subunit 2